MWRHHPQTLRLRRAARRGRDRRGAPRARGVLVPARPARRRALGPGARRRGADGRRVLLRQRRRGCCCGEPTDVRGRRRRRRASTRASPGVLRFDGGALATFDCGFDLPGARRARGHRRRRDALPRRPVARAATPVHRASTRRAGRGRARRTPTGSSSRTSRAAIRDGRPPLLGRDDAVGQARRRSRGRCYAMRVALDRLTASAGRGRSTRRSSTPSTGSRSRVIVTSNEARAAQARERVSRRARSSASVDEAWDGRRRRRRARRTARTRRSRSRRSSAASPVVVDKPLAATAAEAERGSRRVGGGRRAGHRVPEPPLGRRLPHGAQARRTTARSATSSRFESRFERFRPEVKRGLARARRRRRGRRPAARPRRRTSSTRRALLFGHPVRVYAEVARRRGARRSTTTRSSRSSTPAACARTCGWARSRRCAGRAWSSAGCAAGSPSTASTRRSPSSLDGHAPGRRRLRRARARRGSSTRRASARSRLERGDYEASTRACATGCAAAPPPVDPRDSVAVLRVLEAARTQRRARTRWWSCEDEPRHLGARPDGHPLRARRLPARARAASRRRRRSARAVAGLGDLMDDYEFHYPQELSEENLDEVRDALDGHGIYTIATGTHLDPRFGKGGLSSPDDAIRAEALDEALRGGRLRRRRSARR